MRDQSPDTVRDLPELSRVHRVSGSGAFKGSVEDFQNAAGTGGENSDPITEKGRLCDTVRDEKHGLSPMGYPHALQVKCDLFPGERIQGAEWFVHEQHRGLMQDRSAEGDALLHPSRQLEHVTIFVCGEANLVKQRMRTISESLAVESAYHCLKHHVLQNRHPGQQNRGLEHESHVGPGPHNRLATDRDPSGRRSEEPCRKLQ
jgi:hypothetical protein